MDINLLKSCNTLEEFQRHPRSLRRLAWLSWWRPQGLPWMGIPNVSKFAFNRAARRKMARLARSKR